MLRATCTAGSLRFWVTGGMMLAILPLMVSAMVGYVVLDRGLIAPFADIASRQRNQIDPTQRLQILLWEATVPLGLYLDDGNPSEPAAYRALQQRIEAGFVRVHHNLQSENEAQALVERAYADWSVADRLANEIFSARWTPGDQTGIKLADHFDETVAAAANKLGALYDDLAVGLERDHQKALLAYQRSEWVAAIAAAISLSLMVTGIIVIGRFMLPSIDRLVEGVARFAAGDREHRIEVHVPPELRKVADEFNQMIVRIRDSEAALADQAHRDQLTGLLNRRAFDERLTEAFAHRRRFDEEIGLLMLDLDHFKRINDKYGHAAGDEVLRAVAVAVHSSLREIDKAFRIGGEEFAVLLTGADRTAAEATAERLRATIAARSLKVEGRKIPVTVSVGIAVIRGEHDADWLLRAADAALYRAKKRRNRVVFADQIVESAA